jgi:hypothetical protein
MRILKTASIVAVLAASSLVLQAQGVINFFTFNNTAGLGRIYTDTTLTTQAGTGYFAQLYGAPVNDTSLFLPMVGAASGTGIDELGSGVGNFGNVKATQSPTREAGTTFFYQVAAWTGGATLADAFLNTTSGKVGFSQVIQVTLGGTFGTDTFTVPQANGFANFGLTPVPEPSVVALGVLGALVLLFRRRK